MNHNGELKARLQIDRCKRISHFGAISSISCRAVKHSTDNADESGGLTIAICGSDSAILNWLMLCGPLHRLRLNIHERNRQPCAGNGSRALRMRGRLPVEL